MNRIKKEAYYIGTITENEVTNKEKIIRIDIFIRMNGYLSRVPNCEYFENIPPN